MDRSEWDDDDQYPSSPVPAHERGWRHPSEVGATNWVQSEPPLAIGRGLTVATGAVGTMLALAVLWAMLPTHAGRSAVSSVRSTIAARPTTGLRSDATISVASTAATTSSPPSTESSGTVVPDTTSVAPVDSQPLPTYQVGASTVVAQGAVAVAVDGGNLVITTASAVAADRTVELLLPDGGVERARVLLVDQHTGLAVLAPEAVSRVGGFALGTALSAGDVLTVYGDQPLEMAVDAEGRIDTAWAAGHEVREGAPVVNQRGELVALCTHGDDSDMELVPLDDLDGLRRALGAAIAPTVWLGLVINDDPSGDLTIGAVDPTGPAAAAGLAVGDAIVAVDGDDVTDSAQLAGMLAVHQPGDVVAFTLQRTDGSTSVLQVELAAPKTSV